MKNLRQLAESTVREMYEGSETFPDPLFLIKHADEAEGFISLSEFKSDMLEVSKNAGRDVRRKLKKATSLDFIASAIATFLHPKSHTSPVTGVCLLAQTTKATNNAVAYYCMDNRGNYGMGIAEIREGKVVGFIRDTPHPTDKLYPLFGSILFAVHKATAVGGYEH